MKNMTTYLLVFFTGVFLPFGNLEIDGFTKLGNDAPAIKVKKLSGTLLQEGFPLDRLLGTIQHNIADRSKILSVSVVLCTTDFCTTPGWETINTPSITAINSGAECYLYYTDTEVVVLTEAGNNSQFSVGDEFKILIIYED